MCPLLWVHYTAKFKGCSISLRGDIELNCYFEISDVIANDATTNIILTNGGEEQKFPVSSLKKLSDGRYILSFQVSAAQMNDIYTVKVICRNHLFNENTISVRKYADYILQHQHESDEYEKAAPLIKAMLNYGGYAQQYFGYKESNLANSGLYTNSTDPVLNKKIIKTVFDGYNYNELCDKYITQLSQQIFPNKA